VQNTRKTLLKQIRSLQQLIPGEDYALYIKQCEQKNLQFVSPHSFFPAMDENSPGSLNDVELNVLCKARKNYLENVFIPVIVEKQMQILKSNPRESDKQAVSRWTELISSCQSPDKLITLIEDINRRKKPMAKSGRASKKPLWKKVLGL
jgi:hypothetical protein